MLEVYATLENSMMIGGVAVPRGVDKSRQLAVMLFKYGNLYSNFGDFEGYRVLPESGKRVKLAMEHQAGGGVAFEIPELSVLQLTLGRTLIDQLGLQGDGNDVWMISMGKDDFPESGMLGRNNLVKYDQKFNMDDFGHVLGK